MIFLLGNGVPLCYDKVLDEADFRKIKLFRQKQRIEKENKNYSEEDSELEDEELEEDELDEEGEFEDEDEEIEDEEENCEDEEEEEEENDDDEDMDEDEEDLENNSQEGNKQTLTRKGILKNKKSKKGDMIDEEVLEESEEDANPHGFVSEQNITYFKKRGK